MDIGTSNNDPYNILLDHDGRIIGSFRVGNNGIKPCKRHEDSKYVFEHGKLLPYVKEAEKICTHAASKIPEAKFIGWDVAITKSGPVIVEANGISGTPSPYQVIHYFCFGHGNADEIKNMLKYGMDGVSYKGKFTSLCFADLKYLWKSHATPNTLQQFLLLLQNALHNHGVEFISAESVYLRDVNCNISYNKETHSIIFQTDKEHTVNLPDTLPSDIFKADILAHTIAETIYNQLSNVE